MIETQDNADQNEKEHEMMTIRPNATWNEFEVDSDSGNTYSVSYCGGGDEHGDVRIWECDCRAGQFGKVCKHIHAVAAYCDEIAA